MDPRNQDKKISEQHVKEWGNDIEHAKELRKKRRAAGGTQLVRGYL